MIDPKQLLRLFNLVPRYPRPPLDTVLTRERLMLRAAQPQDWSEWQALRAASRDFLQPWEPTWASNALTETYFRRNLQRQWREWRAGEGYAWLIFKRDLGFGNRDLAEEKSPKSQMPNAQSPLIGGITINDVTRGVAQRGTLGYWIGQDFTNQGYMTEAVRLVCEFGFAQLRLHRIEASCLPHNEPSKRLLDKNGFRLEGRAAHYLRINGRWEDHLLWGLVNPEAR
jgi:ribosomal-protein-alanine N-acetyltransferase